MTGRASSWRDRLVGPLPGPVRRAGRLAIDLAHRPAARHRHLAGVRARVAEARWRAQRRRLGNRPVVGVSLVEHLGDIVAAEPVVRHLRERNPDAALVWVVGRRYAELVRHHPDLDGVLELGCLTEWLHLRDACLFDHQVDLQLHGRRCITCQVPLDRPPTEQDVTVKNYYADGCLLDAFCTAGRLPRLRGAPRLHLPAGAAAAVDRLDLPPRPIVVHGLSNQDVRDWRPERWRELVEALAADHGRHVVEVGLRSALDGSPRRGVERYRDLCGRLDLTATAEVIRRAALFVGIDSGPAHLANAVGAPGVILLGRYRHYDRYTPYSGGYGDGRRATLVRNEDGPAADLPVERVLDAIDRRLALAGADAVRT